MWASGVFVVSVWPRTTAPPTAAATPAETSAFKIVRRMAGILSLLANDPCRHRPLILDDRGLDGIEKPAAEPASYFDEQRRVDEIAFGAVGQQTPASADRADTALDANRRGEPAPKRSTLLEHAPHPVHHRAKLIVVFRKVQHGAAEDDIGGLVREGRALDGLDAEVRGRQRRSQRRRKMLRVRNRRRILIVGENLEAVPQQVNKVAAMAAAGVEDAHAWTDASLQELVEEIDVDLPEVRLEILHRCYVLSDVASAAFGPTRSCACSQISRIRSPAGTDLAIAADCPSQ